MLDSYHFSAIIAALIAGYAISFILAKRGRLKMIIHRRIWNYVLLFSFLASGLLGLVLTVMVEYELSMAWYREFLWLHVEFGIAMAFVALAHIAWHWRYFWRKSV
jgi:hypothetical protein